MTDLWLRPARVFDDGALLEGRALAIEGDRVTAVVGADKVPPGAPVQALDGILAPGLVDLQVNGGGGVLFNSDPTPAGLRRITAAHRARGSVAILPTVITDAPNVLERAADAVLDGHVPGVAGLHIEGPHIAVARRGTHAAAFIRPLDDRTFATLRRLRDRGVPVMLTLAPEAATQAQIAALDALGVVVSLGHTDASADQARAGFEAGARCVTHLFNAMSQMTGRAPGLVGAAINSDVHAGIICDGIHVSNQMIALAIRARPVPDRMFLVSDAMPTVGGPDDFTLYGATIRLESGRLVNAEGALAGAHTTMAEGLARLAGVIGLEAQAALRMAISTPARLMGLDGLAQLTGRDLADLVVLDEGLQFQGALPGKLDRGI